MFNTNQLKFNEQILFIDGQAQTYLGLMIAGRIKNLEKYTLSKRFSRYNLWPFYTFCKRLPFLVLQFSAAVLCSISSLGANVVVLFITLYLIYCNQKAV